MMTSNTNTTYRVPYAVIVRYTHGTVTVSDAMKDTAMNMMTIQSIHQRKVWIFTNVTNARAQELFAGAPSVERT